MLHKVFVIIFVSTLIPKNAVFEDLTATLSTSDAGWRFWLDFNRFTTAP